MQEAYEWIKKIIDSCENEFHYCGAEKLIELFHEMYGEETIDPEKGELTLKQQLAMKMVNVVL